MSKLLNEIFQMLSFTDKLMFMEVRQNLNVVNPI